MRTIPLIRKFTLSTVSTTLALCAVSAPVLADMAQSANVMAPLEVDDYGAFENQMATAKDMGVTAV